MNKISLWATLAMLGVLPAMSQPYSVEILGHSHQGRLIECWKFGSGPTPVLVIGGTHGDELTAYKLVERLRDDLMQEEASFPDLTIYVVPFNNPDGIFAKTRVNALGVDPNRNFDAIWSPKYKEPRYFPGHEPMTEPETVLIANLVLRIKPARVLSVHAPLDFIDYDGEEGKRLAEKMAKYNRMTVKTIDYPTTGSFGKFCLANNVPLVTLEMPPKILAGKAWGWQKQAIYAFISG